MSRTSRPAATRRSLASAASSSKCRIRRPRSRRSRRSRPVNRAVLLLVLLIVPGFAAAQVAICSFSTNPGMAFGAYDDSSAAPTNSTTDIVVRCLRNGGPPNPSVTVTLGAGNSGSVAARELRSGANPMSYNLYRDSARTQVWGQTAGVDAVTVTVNGIPNNSYTDTTFTIYGRIPALQNVPAGAYSDSVQMTVTP